jgi:uncharacterized protein with HEPN domain
MQRDPRSFLWDVRERADLILQFVAGRSLDQYLADAMLRAAVERNFEVIGEALHRLRGVDPATAAKIPTLSQAIGMRNVLIHGYAEIDDHVVWRTVHNDLPGLRSIVDALLTAAGPPDRPLSPKAAE